MIGAPNSSNSKRLVEVGTAAGCPYSMLIQRAADIDWRALAGVRAIGLTAGASAPEVLVNEVIDAFRARFAVTVDLVETAVEDIEFKVPRILREHALNAETPAALPSPLPPAMIALAEELARSLPNTGPNSGSLPPEYAWETSVTDPQDGQLDAEALHGL